MLAFQFLTKVNPLFINQQLQIDGNTRKSNNISMSDHLLSLADHFGIWSDKCQSTFKKTIITPATIFSDGQNYCAYENSQHQLCNPSFWLKAMFH